MIIYIRPNTIRQKLTNYKKPKTTHQQLLQLVTVIQER